MFNVDVGTPGKLFRVTAANAITGTSAAAVSASFSAVSAPSAASATGTTPSKIAVTHFSGSSDVATQYTIEAPTGTIIWQLYLAGTNNTFSQDFDPPLTYQTVGGTVLFKAGGMLATNKAAVNGAGYEIASG